MTNEQLKKEWLKSQERQKSFEGWDFSSIYEDFWQEELSWSYEKIVNQYLTKDMFLLDMGTGGGELLESFQHPESLTSVTEGWETNYHLLLNKWSESEITIKFVKEDDQLDYLDNSFDIVLNSHESFDLNEVKRVLKPGGIFISQQVGDLNGVNLASRLIPNFSKKDFSLHLSSVKKELMLLGFEVLAEFEEYPAQKFFSMDALIYYVRTISWEFPDFEVNTHFDELLFLLEELKRQGFIYNQEHRFLFVAKKPNQ